MPDNVFARLSGYLEAKDAEVLVHERERAMKALVDKLGQITVTERASETAQ